MKKIVFWPMIAAVFIMLYPAAGLAATEESPFVSPMLAGQTIPVGEVRVWNDDMNVYVKYVITNPDWCMTETHLAVEQNLEDIPQNPGGPIPGQFEYSDELDCAPEHIYTIPFTSGNQVYIAAHAAVETVCGYEDPDLALFAGTLPTTATIMTTDPYLNGPAYFPIVNVDASDDPLTGDYEGWCVSTSLGIKAEVPHTANVFSSYDFPDGLVDFPENIDKINWILNQQFVGKPTECNPDLPVYTYGSVQRAIWSLIDNENSTLSLGPYSLCQITEILDGAEEYGLFYEPGCNEFVGVLLEPFTPTGLPAQPLIIPSPLPCDPVFCDETAWGDGTRFTDPGNWATYFTYVIEGNTEDIEVEIEKLSKKELRQLKKELRRELKEKRRLERKMKKMMKKNRNPQAVEAL